MDRIRAREQGVSTQEMWNELCDEVIESHLDLGKMDDDQVNETLKQALYLAWLEYIALAGEESDRAISEDPEAPRV